MPATTREWHFVQRPQGLPGPECYELVERELPALQSDDLLVRNLVLSMDPYMRPRMDDGKSYVPKFELGRALTGAAVGEVVESHNEAFPVGSLVAHEAGWREHAVVKGRYARVLEQGQHPSSYHLGILGIPSLTAYAGLFHVAGFQQDESIFVSGAAGAVGGLVGQFAKLAGAKRVVGSAGSLEKVDYVVNELGFDAAFNYRDGDVLGQLRRRFPDGFEVYFDNVGGEHLAASLEVINDFGRMAICGTISTYNDADRRFIPGNLFRIVAKRLRLQGFIVSDHEAIREEFITRVTGWLDSGQLVYRESVSHGLDCMPDAFVGMLTGANTGKAIIRLGDDPV